MNNPLVSIIIPTYNRAHLIGETLDSVLAQTYKNWECIVVDDGSTDYTDELLAFYTVKDSRIKYYHRPKNRVKGANACRNYGFEMSKGEFVNWFDSDDLMLNDFIGRGIELFKINADINVIVSDYEIFNDNDGEIYHFQRNKIEQLDLDYYTGKINFGCPNLIWNQASVSNFKFDVGLVRAQELDFHFQIFSNRKIRWKQLVGTKVKIRRHSNSITSNFQEGNYKSLRSELWVRRKIIKYLFYQNQKSEVIKSAFKIYLKTVRKLYKSYSINETFKELEKNQYLLNNGTEFYIWKYHLLFLLCIFKITGREHRLKLHIFNLSEFIYERR